MRPEVPHRRGRLAGGWEHPDSTSQDAYKSYCKVPDMMLGDLERPGQLEALARGRAFRGELIVIASNLGGTALGLNLVLSLQAQGISHVVWLTDDPLHCAALHLSPAHVTCASTTFMSGPEWLPGWKKWGLRPCAGCHDAVMLWLGRLHYVARLVDLGINAMYLDTDFTLQDDLYRHLKSGPAARHNLLFMREGVWLPAVNIGFIYCQRCAPGGRGQWVLDEAIRRIQSHLREERPEDIYQRHIDNNVSIVPPAGFKGAKVTLNDQAHVDDCIESSVYGRESRRRTQAAWMDYASNKALMRSMGFGGRYPHWRNDVKGMVWEPLQMPGNNTPAETVACPPTWLVGGWAGQFNESVTGGKQGYWEGGRAPPAAHFVGAPDKIVNIKIAGFWNYDADAVGEWVRQAHTRLTAQGVAAAVRDDPSSAAGAEALERLGAELTASLPSLPDLRRRLVSRPVIAYKGPKIRHADVLAFKNDYFRLLTQLVLLGVVAGGRPAVIPPLDCASAWISRSRDARHGIEQGPWRWDWRPGETQRNGAGVGNCSSVAPGAGEGASSRGETEGDGLCCYPWLTGNAPFPACLRGDVGMMQHLDLIWMLSHSDWAGSGAAHQRVTTVKAANYVVPDGSGRLVGGLQPLRQALQSTQARAAQVIYVEAEHWRDFPDVRWEALTANEQHKLSQFLRTCPHMSKYVHAA